MKPENAIEVHNVVKAFKVYYDKGHTLKEKILFSKRRKYEERQVLKGISFEVQKGEAIGLIGHNGCGKSTTLKLLTRIIYPDSGKIEMRGRVSSLIELGAGFHPDMSGKENIYINASIFGLTRKEIDARMNDIIAFSELEEFIDNPVRTYSSGMYMRLAFAVAINVDADILLIDEILAVGDANFQAKCFKKLHEIKKAGTTIVIVSHALEQIEQICERSIWIHDGKIKAEGVPKQIHQEYLRFMKNKRQELNGEDQEPMHSPIVKERGNRDVEIRKVELLNEAGVPCNVFKVGSKMFLSVEYEQQNPEVKESEFGFHFFRNDGTDCYGTNTFIEKRNKVQLKEHGKIVVTFDPLNLLQGKYNMEVAFHDEYGLTYHHIFEVLPFEVINSYAEVGVLRIDHIWNFDGIEPGKRLERN